MKMSCSCQWWNENVISVDAWSMSLGKHPSVDSSECGLLYHACLLPLKPTGLWIHLIAVSIPPGLFLLFPVGITIRPVLNICSWSCWTCIRSQSMIWRSIICIASVASHSDSNGIEEIRLNCAVFQINNGLSYNAFIKTYSIYCQCW